MKSTAAIGHHPMHPMLIVVPMGGWIVSMISDIAYAVTGDAFWYQMAFYSMGIGIIGALMAAVPGFIDYFTVRMSAAGRKAATTHMVLNLIVVGLYAINMWLRWDNGALTGARWNMALGLAIVSMLMLMVSGWLGGEMSYRHKIGVVEQDDVEATEIGEAEAHPSPKQRRRGLQP